MSKQYNSWIVYSVGIYMVWGAVFLVRWHIKSKPDLADLGLVFSGFSIAWLSATIKFVLISNKMYGLTFSSKK
jgi:hypothetical protein